MGDAQSASAQQPDDLGVGEGQQHPADAHQRHEGEADVGGDGHLIALGAVQQQGVGPAQRNRDQRAQHAGEDQRARAGHVVLQGDDGGEQAGDAAQGHAHVQADAALDARQHGQCQDAVHAHAHQHVAQHQGNADVVDLGGQAQVDEEQGDDGSRHAQLAGERLPEGVHQRQQQQRDARDQVHARVGGQLDLECGAAGEHGIGLLRGVDVVAGGEVQAAGADDRHHRLLNGILGLLVQAVQIRNHLDQFGPQIVKGRVGNCAAGGNRLGFHEVAVVHHGLGGGLLDGLLGLGLRLGGHLSAGSGGDLRLDVGQKLLANRILSVQLGGQLDELRPQRLVVGNLGQAAPVRDRCGHGAEELFVELGVLLLQLHGGEVARHADEGVLVNCALRLAQAGNLLGQGGEQGFVVAFADKVGPVGHGFVHAGVELRIGGLLGGAQLVVLGQRALQRVDLADQRVGVHAADVTVQGLSLRARSGLGLGAERLDLVHAHGAEVRQGAQLLELGGVRLGGDAVHQAAGGHVDHGAGTHFVELCGGGIHAANDKAGDGGDDQHGAQNEQHDRYDALGHTGFLLSCLCHARSPPFTFAPDIARPKLASELSGRRMQLILPSDTMAMRSQIERSS